MAKQNGAILQVVETDGSKAAVLLASITGMAGFTYDGNKHGTVIYFGAHTLRVKDDFADCFAIWNEETADAEEMADAALEDVIEEAKGKIAEAQAVTQSLGSILGNVAAETQRVQSDIARAVEGAGKAAAALDSRILKAEATGNELAERAAALAKPTEGE